MLQGEAEAADVDVERGVVAAVERGAVAAVGAAVGAAARAGASAAVGVAAAAVEDAAAAVAAAGALEQENAGQSLCWVHLQKGLIMIHPTNVNITVH